MTLGVSVALKPHPRRVACPRCGSPSGQACIVRTQSPTGATLTTRAHGYHRPRITAAEAAHDDAVEAGADPAMDTAAANRQRHWTNS